MLLDSDRLSAWSNGDYSLAYQGSSSSRGQVRRGENTFVPATLEEADHFRRINSAIRQISCYAANREPDMPTSSYVWLAVNFFTSRNFELSSIDGRTAINLEWEGTKHRVYFCVLGPGEAKALVYDKLDQKRAKLLERVDVHMDFEVLVSLIKKYLDATRSVQVLPALREQLPVRTEPQVGRDGRVRVVGIIEDVRSLLMSDSYEELNDLLSRVGSKASEMLAAQLLAYLSVSAPARAKLSAWAELRPLVIEKLEREGRDVAGEMVGLMG